MGEMVTSYGVPVTGTYGYLNATFSFMDKNQIDCVVPVFDAGKNWRKAESDAYKANRTGVDEAHRADMSLLLDDVLPALGMNPVGVSGYEADDVIGTISRNSSAYTEVFILTCDRDLLQLVTDRVKVILFNSAKKITLMGPQEVEDHFGVPPSEVKFFKALNGDSSDNVKGIEGIGPKTAVKIIREARENSLDPVLSLSDRICLHEKVQRSFEKFFDNLRLVSLDESVPDLRWLASTPPQREEVKSVFQQLEFKSFLKEPRFSKILKCLGTQD
jgi:DNA polymerase-1